MQFLDVTPAGVYKDGQRTPALIAGSFRPSLLVVPLTRTFTSLERKNERLLPFRRVTTRTGVRPNVS